jgi:hypothetical protein
VRYGGIKVRKVSRLGGRRKIYLWRRRRRRKALERRDVFHWSQRVGMGTRKLNVGFVVVVGFARLALIVGAVHVRNRSTGGRSSHVRR